MVHLQIVGRTSSNMTTEIRTAILVKDSPFEDDVAPRGDRDHERIGLLADALGGAVAGARLQREDRRVRHQLDVAPRDLGRGAVQRERVPVRIAEHHAPRPARCSGGRRPRASRRERPPSIVSPTRRYQMLSQLPRMSATCHSPNDMYPDNGRTDLWHWKTSRSNPLGYVNDQYTDPVAQGRVTDAGDERARRGHADEVDRAGQFAAADERLDVVVDGEPASEPEAPRELMKYLGVIYALVGEKDLAQAVPLRGGGEGGFGPPPEARPGPQPYVSEGHAGSGDVNGWPSAWSGPPPAAPGPSRWRGAGHRG